MLKFKRVEYELTKEEKVKAKFIIATANKWNEKWASGIGVGIKIERMAFEDFKDDFYTAVRMRLGISNRAIAISEDGNKLITGTIENSDSK